LDVRAGIKVPETSAVSPMGLAAPPTGQAIGLSPINKRRWENFKANRRGYWSLWVFLTLFVVSLTIVFPSDFHISRHGFRQRTGSKSVRHGCGLS